MKFILFCTLRMLWCMEVWK